ncbi:hypothetical protein RB195_010360 [Necator americanus]|uniref:Uncharacterized protein n=1 Tax=Necator americanus TaxID=51031 RepID=A0ABR1CXN1_NECAM
MNSVGHLFMGGVVRIDSCESHLFVSSSIEEIVFEGLTGHLDAAFLLDADIRLINIRDSILEYETDDANRGIAVPQQTKSTSKRHNSAVFYNVSVNLLVPDLLAHFGHVTFFNSSITRVRPNQRSQVKYLRNDLIITFLSTNLRNIDSYAFSNISAHILNITNSVIGKINRFVASGATFEHIYITNTEVKVLDEQVFAHSQIKRFEVAGGQVDHILSSAFQFSRVEEMFIDSSRINILDKHAFNGSRIHTLSISKTTVNNVKSEPFDGSQITSLRISNCSFCGTPAREVFSGLTPNRLAVVNSTFDCNPSDCEMNAMLLKPSRHELFWYFENNKCRTQLIDDNKNVPMCVQHSVFLQSGLSCRLSWALADCVCTASTATLPKVNATVVVVGDCEHLSIADSEASPIALYLFRISKCDVLKVPSAIKTMKIYHSNAVLHQGAMANNQFTSLSLSHANIYKVARKAISNISVEELTVKDSFLSNWHMEAVTASWIKHATFTDSQIGDLRSLLQATAHLRIQNSVMFSGDGLPSMRSVHLNNNTVLCCCGNEGSNCENDLSMRQNCTRHFGSFTCSVGSMHGTILVIVAYFVYTVVFL